MRITFTGKQEALTPTQERKLAMQFAKLSKLLERRGEKEALVILGSQRHLQCGEVRINFYGQTLVGAGTGNDQFTAIMDAVEKVQKQALKARTKFRDTKRDSPARTSRRAPAEAAITAAPAPKGAKKRVSASKAVEALSAKPTRVVRAASRTNGKPMTIDEAMLAMESGQDYMVFRDSETDKVSVLVRRRDGKVDLIEA